MKDSSTTDHDEHHSAPRDGHDPIHVRAIVEVYDDRPPECTLFPVAVSDQDERLSSWITARGDAFVPLEAAR